MEDNKQPDTTKPGVSLATIVINSVGVHFGALLLMFGTYFLPFNFFSELGLGVLVFMFQIGLVLVLPLVAVGLGIRLNSEALKKQGNPGGMVKTLATFLPIGLSGIYVLVFCYLFVAATGGF